MSDVLSREISSILHLPNILPLGPVLGCNSKADIASTIKLLRLPEQKLENSERGVPGEVVSKNDKDMLSLHPSRKFLPNEIVAWEDGEHFETCQFLTFSRPRRLPIWCCFRDISKYFRAYINVIFRCNFIGNFYGNLPSWWSYSTSKSEDFSLRNEVDTHHKSLHI